MRRTLESRVYTYSQYMKQKFGRKVFRVGLSTGIPCPHRISTGGCIYCNPETFTGEYQYQNLTVEQQLEKAIPRIIKNCGDVGLLAYFQDETSTAGAPDLLNRKFKEAIEYPGIMGMIVSTRPDHVDQEIIDLLKSYEVPVSLEIGLQSINDKSLLYLNRGHKAEAVKQAVDLCSKNEIDLGVHIITGIPGEDLEDMTRTIEFINSRQIIKEVKFHNLVIYKDTSLEKLYQENKITPLTLEEHIDILSELLSCLRGDKVVSRLFTSNIRRSQIALGNYEGSKPEWLNRLRLLLIEKDIVQGCRTELTYPGI